MPKWLEDRVEHILAKNPSMPKSEAFGIGTQQMHALGKSPKGYGTTEGRETARAKYRTPGDDKKTANPGNLDSPKMASFEPVFFNALMDELVDKTAGVMGNVAGALRNPNIAGHATELAGLGVLAVPGLDTMQAAGRARLAGDKTPHAVENRRLLGEGAHAAADVGGLGILMGPEMGHLRHLAKMGAAGEPKTDPELKEVGRQRGVTNLAAEAAREKGRRGERFGEAFGRIAGGVGGAALGRHLIGGRIGTVAGMAGGLMAGGRVGKELGTERDIRKNASAFPGGYSAYGGNQAPNPPGMKAHSPLAPYREPPLAVKQAYTLGELVAGGGAAAGAAAGGLVGGALDPNSSAGRGLLGGGAGALAGGTAGLLLTPDSLFQHAPRSAIAAGGLLGAGLGYMATRKGKAQETSKQAGVGVGSGMSASQYSGPLSYGAFKMTSGIPAFRAPEMTRQDSSHQPAGWMVGAGKHASVGIASGALNNANTPAGRLAASQRVGAPQIKAPSGPSIAEISKPKGFGMPLAGTTKPGA